MTTVRAAGPVYRGAEPHGGLHVTSSTRVRARRDGGLGAGGGPLSLVGLAAALADPGQLTGLVGWVADVIATLGPFGVSVLVAVENVFPPIPSEVVLPLPGSSPGVDGAIRG